MPFITQVPHSEVIFGKHSAQSTTGLRCVYFEGRVYLVLRVANMEIRVQ